MGNRNYWRSLPERFGFLPRSFRQIGPGAIWLHAVSMGEILAFVEFARALRAEFPHSRLFVSTATLAGRATAEQKPRGTADGIFAPVDYIVIRRSRTTRHWAWLRGGDLANLFREVHRTGAGLAVVNGRISDRALPCTYAATRVSGGAGRGGRFTGEEMRQRFALGASRSRWAEI